MTADSYMLHNVSHQVIENDEQRLLLRLKDGDQEAFEYFYEKHKRAIFDFAMNLTGRHKENAQDATAHAFDVLWTNRHSLSDPGHLLSFLYMVVRNKIYNMALSAKRRSKLRTSYSALYPDTESDAHVFMERSITEFYRKLYLEIEKLPSPAKEIFLASVLGNRKKKEIAQSFDISEKTVYNEKRKAIELLQHGLLNSGIDILLILVTCLIPMTYWLF